MSLAGTVRLATALLAITLFVPVGADCAYAGWELLSRVSLPGEPCGLAVHQGRLLIATALEGAVAVLDERGPSVGSVVASHLHFPSWCEEHQAVAVLSPDHELLLLGEGSPALFAAPYGSRFARINVSARGLLIVWGAAGRILVSSPAYTGLAELKVPFVPTDAFLVDDGSGPVAWVLDASSYLWRVTTRAVDRVGTLPPGRSWQLIAASQQSVVLWDQLDKATIWHQGQQAAVIHLPGADATAASATESGIQLFMSTARLLLAIHATDDEAYIRMIPTPGRIAAMTVDASTGQLHAVTGGGEVYRLSRFPGAGTPEPPTN